MGGHSPSPWPRSDDRTSNGVEDRSTDTEMQAHSSTRLAGARVLQLAGLTALAIDVGLTTWGMHRDSQWNAAVLELCKSGYLPTHLPPLPENGWIGVVTLCSIGPAVVVTLVGAIRQGRHTRTPGGIVAAVAVTAVATLVAFWLLLIGLLMIEPRAVGTGTDGSALRADRSTPAEAEAPARWLQPRAMRSKAESGAPISYSRSIATGQHDGHDVDSDAGQAGGEAGHCRGTVAGVATLSPAATDDPGGNRGHTQ